MLARLVDHINRSGPIRFDAFMEACLYDPEAGFFAAGDVRPGTQGDFVTSPEISTLFGELIARWADGVRGEAWATVEIGAGSGVLLAPMLAALGETAAFAIERSRSARAAIGELLPAVTLVDSIGEVAAPGAVVVLNEVLDNLPAALVRRTEQGWRELAVAVEGEELTLVEVPPRDDVATWASRHLTDLPVGEMASVQLAASALVESVLETFDEVAICVIDYGGSAAELAGKSGADVVRTYRHQRRGFDYLVYPGHVDITVDVNTDAVVAVGHAAGAEVQVTTQREFLLSLGADELLSGFRSAETALARSGDVLGQLKERSRGVELRALLDPSGLGSFKVITIVRTPT